MPTTRRGAHNSPSKPADDSSITDSPTRVSARIRARATQRGDQTVQITPPRQDNKSKKNDNSEQTAGYVPEKSPQKGNKRGGNRTQGAQKQPQEEVSMVQEETPLEDVPENKEEIMNLAASVIVGKLKKTLGAVAAAASSKPVRSEEADLPKTESEVSVKNSEKKLKEKKITCATVQIERVDDNEGNKNISGKLSDDTTLDEHLLKVSDKLEKVTVSNVSYEETDSTHKTSPVSSKDSIQLTDSQPVTSTPVNQSSDTLESVTLGLPSEQDWTKVPLDVEVKDPFSELEITEEHLHQIQAVLSTDEGQKIFESDFPGTNTTAESDSLKLDVFNSSQEQDSLNISTGSNEGFDFLHVGDPLLSGYAPLEHSYVRADETTPKRPEKTEQYAKRKDESLEAKETNRKVKIAEKDEKEDFLSPIRRSTRVIEAEQRAMAEKIRQENLQREREALDKMLEEKKKVELEDQQKQTTEVQPEKSKEKEDKAKHDDKLPKEESKSEHTEHQNKSKDRRPSDDHESKKKKAERRRSQSVSLSDEPILFTPDVPTNKPESHKVKVEKDVDKLPNDKQDKAQSDTSEAKKEKESFSSSDKHRRESISQEKKESSSLRKKKEKDVQKKKDKMEKQKDSDSDMSDGLSYRDDSDDPDWGNEEYDDPHKLWCICREPHGDRFMICCDRCEEWYHGDCVGITKKRGKAMDDNDEEWICPVCKDKEIIAKLKTEKHSERQRDKVERVESADRERKRNLQALKDRKERKDSHRHHSIDEEGSLKLGEIRKKDHSKDSPDDAKKRKKRFKVFKPHKDKPPKQHCIATGCSNWASHGSIYCSQECISKHATESIQLIEKEKTKLGFKKEKKTDSGQVLDKVLDKIVVMERHTGRIVTGPNAPTQKNLHLWLEKNPTFEVLRPGQQQGYISSSKFYRKEMKEELKKEAHAVQPKQEPSSSSGPSDVRLNVRKHLKDLLVTRAGNADDIILSQAEIKLLVISIEDELYKYFGDTGSKYKSRYRTLVFNIKDPKNKGLFRKILNGEVKPNKLVRMTPEELASKELAKWREMETKHELKKIEDIEKEATAKPIRKITHKGEIEIQEESLADLESPKSTKKSKADENQEQARDILSSIVSDTTSQHRSHLFDLNCKICTGKIAPPKEEAPVPKRLKIAKTVSTEEPEEKKPVKDELEFRSETVESPGPSSEPSSTVRSPADFVQSTSTEGSLKKTSKTPSIWKGFIFMPEVTKFFTTACAVSGPTDFVRTDLPDSIHVCGRIPPNTIWDYLGKIKQSASRDIIIIGFNASTDEEKTAYIQFYKYLNTRQRCSVVGQFSKLVKDMYIIPLASHAPVPPVLLPFEGPGLEEIRPHMLLGVIVRQKMKRHQSVDSQPSSHHSNSPRPSKRHRSEDKSPAVFKKHRSTSSLEEQSFTPPSTPLVTPDASLHEEYVPEHAPPPSKQKPMLNTGKARLDPIVQEYAGADPSKLEVDPGPGASPYNPSDNEDDPPYDPEDNTLLHTKSAESEPLLPEPATLNVGTVVTELSQGSNKAKTAAAVLATFATTSDLAGKQKLLEELTKQVELQKQQLEAKKQASGITLEEEPSSVAASTQSTLYTRNDTLGATDVLPIETEQKLDSQQKSSTNVPKNITLPVGMLRHLSGYDSDEDEQAPEETETTVPATEEPVETVAEHSTSRSKSPEKVLNFDASKFANLPTPIMDLLSGSKKQEEQTKQQSFASVFNRLFGSKKDDPNTTKPVKPPPAPPGFKTGIWQSVTTTQASMMQNVYDAISKPAETSEASHFSSLHQQHVAETETTNSLPGFESTKDSQAPMELEAGEVVEDTQALAQPSTLEAPPPPPLWMTQSSEESAPEPMESDYSDYSRSDTQDYPPRESRDYGHGSFGRYQEPPPWDRGPPLPPPPWRGVPDRPDYRRRSYEDRDDRYRRGPPPPRPNYARDREDRGWRGGRDYRGWERGRGRRDRDYR